MSRGYRFQLRISYNARYIQECTFYLQNFHPPIRTRLLRDRQVLASREPQSCGAHAVPTTRSATPPRLITSMSTLAHAAPPRPRHGSNYPVDVATVQHLITQADNKNCELDPAPKWLLKHFVNELSTFTILLFNAAFRDSFSPSLLKRAVITSALKKPTLGPSDFNNYLQFPILRSFLSCLNTLCLIR